MSTPSIGRIVHYQRFDKTNPCAAIIVHADPDQGDLVNLTLFNHDGTQQPMRNIPYAKTLTEGHWSWPQQR